MTFEPPFTEPEPKGLKFEFTMKAITATKNSYGIIFNSFNELEPLFVDFWNRKYIPKAWSVGPLCLAEPPKVRNEARYNYKPIWVQWLDKKLEQRNSVLYIAFGSQTQISPAQLKEIAIGLEESKVNFLWVIKRVSQKFQMDLRRVKGITILGALDAQNIQTMRRKKKNIQTMRKKKELQWLGLQRLIPVERCRIEG